MTSGSWSLSIQDQASRPCFLEVRDGPDRAQVSPENGCYDPTYALFVNLPDQYSVTGLQVCQNSVNERVKGIRIAGRRIEIDPDAGEVVFREQNDERDRLPNCGDSERANPVSCGGGQVASGVRVHFNEGRLDYQDVIVGLELICRNVVKVYR